MDFFEVISSRHSYREEFLDKEVPRDHLIKIVQAGIKAPSAKNAQTPYFVIVDDPKLLKDISSLHTMKAMLTARAMIACFVDKHPDPVYESFSFIVEDMAAAVENMLLAITSLGYASVWIDGWLRVDNRAEKISAILNAPDNKILRILLPIGVAKTKIPQREKKNFDQRASFNQFKDN